MKLFIGGFGEDKLGYVKRLQSADSSIVDFRIWNDFHLSVRDMLAAGLSAEQITEKVLERFENEEDTLIISDEIGNGIVPADSFEREYRELTGRLLCMAAERSDEVMRIICGIGQRIK